MLDGHVPIAFQSHNVNREPRGVRPHLSRFPGSTLVQGLLDMCEYIAPARVRGVQDSHLMKERTGH